LEQLITKSSASINWLC